LLTGGERVVSRQKIEEKTIRTLAFLNLGKSP